MTFGSLLIIAYWAVFTMRFGLNSRLTTRVRANEWEIKLSKKGNDEARIKKAMRMFKILSICKKILNLISFIKNVLLATIIIWLIYFIGAIISGTFILFGYPV